MHGEKRPFIKHVEKMKQNFFFGHAITGVIMAFESCHSSGIYGFQVLSAQCYGKPSGVTARMNSNTKKAVVWFQCSKKL